MLLMFLDFFQIYLECRKFARGSICRPCVAYGGTSVGHQLGDIQRGCNILIATPGRLMDFINKGRVSIIIWSRKGTLMLNFHVF